MVGDKIDPTRISGVCLFCETVIYGKGLSVPCAKKAILEHIKDCPVHPLRGYKAKKDYE